MIVYPHWKWEQEDPLVCSVWKSPGTPVCYLHKQVTWLELQSEALISLTANVLLIEDSELQPQVS